MVFEWILIDYNGGTYMSQNVSNDFHSFTLFPGLVDLHFNESVSFFTKVGRWPLFFLRKSTVFGPFWGGNGGLHVPGREEMKESP